MMEQPASSLLPEQDSFPIWQLAKILGCCRQHVVNLVLEGSLEGIDLKSKSSSRSTIRIPRASVESFIEKRQVIVPPPRIVGKHARKH
jgi:hypothetical protein